MEPDAKTFATTGRSRKGEPWVWLTAAGLTLGVVMALGLFLLILVKGTSSFWPRRIDLMEVSKGAAIDKIAGYITQETERRDAQGKLHEEIQVFRGNKDLNGEAFVYIDRSSIKATSRPESLLLVERLEYGPAIVNAVALQTPGGRIEASSAEFNAALEKILQQGQTARTELLVIERKKIGAISRELDALTRAEKSNGVDPQVATARRVELQTDFEKLQAAGRRDPQDAGGIQFPRCHRRRQGGHLSGRKPARRVSIEPRGLFLAGRGNVPPHGEIPERRIPARRIRRAVSSRRFSAPW